MLLSSGLDKDACFEGYVIEILQRFHFCVACRYFPVEAPNFDSNDYLHMVENIIWVHHFAASMLLYFMQKRHSKGQ